MSVGDLEVGDGDLDVVLADWGPGSNMTNDGGRTRLWLNDGTGRFTDATEARMPDIKVRFSWDLELADVDNDGDLDVLVSCKRCPGGSLFRNDGQGRYRDATEAWWPPASNVGEDDNMVAFLDYDSDGDADFVVGSLSGPDRLLINDGHGHLTVRLDVFDGEPTPGTLGIALADLDGDHRMDVVQGQGEHPTANSERVFAGRGLAPDTAPPSVTVFGVRAAAGGPRIVQARVHDRKSPLLPTEWKRVAVEWTTSSGRREAPMRWYGEYLWRAQWPAEVPPDTPYRVCATDAAGGTTCAERPR